MCSMRTDARRQMSGSTDCTHRHYYSGALRQWECTYLQALAWWCHDLTASLMQACRHTRRYLKPCQHEECGAGHCLCLQVWLVYQASYSSACASESFAILGLNIFSCLAIILTGTAFDKQRPAGCCWQLANQSSCVTFLHSDWEILVTVCKLLLQDGAGGRTVQRGGAGVCA